MDEPFPDLPPSLLSLREHLAEQVHNTYVSGRLNEGWTWGTERNDKLKTNPTLIPYSELPESEKDYDRNTAEATLQTILKAGFHIQDPAAPVVDIDELGTLLEDVISNPSPSLTLLRTTWDAARKVQLSEPQLQALSSKALDIGELPLVVDVARSGLSRFPGNVRLAQALALAHLQEGHIEQAKLVLAPFFDKARLQALSPFERREILAAGGRLHKEAWRLQGHRTDLDQAIHFYQRAFQEGDQDSYPLINEAALRLVGHHDQPTAHRLAREVLELTESDQNQWTHPTRAEAYLLLGDTTQAIETYHKAMQADFSWREAARIRDQARWICHEVFGKMNAMDEAFSSLPTILVYSGHRMDEPERTTPRFEEEDIPDVERKIQEAFTQLNPAAIYGSGASGADLLMLEQLDGTIERQMVLACPPDDFVTNSVSPDWLFRFHKQLRLLPGPPTILNRHRPSSSSAVYAYANEVIIGMASLRARRLGLDIKGLVVWDGEAAEGLGGTGHFASLCHKNRIPLTTISPKPSQSTTPTKSPLDPGTRDTPIENEQVIRSILMADVKGFSSLNEDQVMDFQSHYMGCVAQVIEEQPQAPLSCNTWGDALYLVFKTVEQAAGFALDLQVSLRSDRWRAHGLSPKLSLRAALHAGPVFPVIDPVTKTPSFTGNHVTRAARMEPLVEPGQVYVSEEFAALLHLCPASDQYLPLYVGRRRLPKGAGELPLYHLQRRRST